MAFLLLCVCLLPFLYYLATNFLRQKNVISNPRPNGPPGSTGWPLVGETLEMGILGGKGIPEKIYERRMKKHSPEVFKTSILGETITVFCGVSGNKFLFSNENKLVSISWPSTLNKILPHTETILDMGKQSTKVHNILVNFFMPQNMQKYVDIIDAEARKQLDSKWDSQKEVTVLPLIREYTFALTCKIFLSIDDPKSIEEIFLPFQVLVVGILGVPVNIPGTAYNKAIKAANIIREKLSGIIRERKEYLMTGKLPWSRDILWDMITMEDDDGGCLCEAEIADHLLVFLLAGQDTTTTTIIFLLKYLADFPEIYEEVLKEQRCIAKDKQQQLKWEDVVKMKYSWNVTSEVMRLMPPFQGGFRKALTDFTYQGFFIPKGSKLFWTAHTTHKDPNYFPEPEKFDPSRYEGTGPTPYSYVPFGGGFRACPGKDISRVIILAFLHNLVQRFRWEKLLPDEKIVVQPAPNLVKGFPVRLYPL